MAHGARVAVVGVGFFGLLLVQLCRGVAGEIEVVSRRRSARELALAARLHADVGIRPTARPRRRASTSSSRPPDTSSRSTWPRGLCRIRGRLVIVGYHQDGRRSVDLQLWNWRGLDVINAHEREEAVYVRGLREAVAAVADGRLDPAPLLTHSFALEELGDAYRVSTERPDGLRQGGVAR